MILVRFMNSRNLQQGDTLSLSYKDGKFVPRKDVMYTQKTIRPQCSSREVLPMMMPT